MTYDAYQLSPTMFGCAVVDCLRADMPTAEPPADCEDNSVGAVFVGDAGLDETACSDVLEPAVTVVCDLSSPAVYRPSMPLVRRDCTMVH